MQWMVVHEDIYGNRWIIRDGLTEFEADSILIQYTGDYQHHQEYYKFFYTDDTKAQLIVDERILE